MKKLKLIYNPHSGDQSFRYDIDPCLRAFQNGGYDTHIFRSMRPGDIEEHIAYMAAQSYDALVICGGDGSVNLAVNAMMKNNIDIPMGIIPSGTANDFASNLKLPADFSEAAQIIANGNTDMIDLGLVNGRYFINVCAAGMLSNISQRIDSGFKNIFGKLAYYMKGVEQLPNFMPMQLCITHSGTEVQENVFFFCVLNSTGAGGFDKLSPGASINDGLFDFVAFRACPLHELALVFVKALTGEYLDDNRVLFFRDKHIKVKVMHTADVSLLETDIDGERGPDMPIEIENLHNKFCIFVP